VNTLFPLPAKKIDIVHTPVDVAKDIVAFFKPTGKCLDPCRGAGEFLQYLPPGTDWCEIREGRDFFDYHHEVDWIVGNPPYSVFADWLRHSFTIARNIVYLIPANKAFNSYKMMREIDAYGGIAHIYVIGPGSQLRFPIGFAIAAVHFKRGYAGGTQTTFRA